MGNFLFQVAAAIGYATRHQLEFTVPRTTADPKWNPIYLQHLVKPFSNGAESVIREEQEFVYRPIPFDESWRNKTLVLDGYWQSEGYFKEYRAQVLKAFNFPWSSRSGNVSVHVRRGDYLTIQRNGMFKHPSVPKEWLEAQMAKFEGYHFIFFSDDIEWCRKEFAERPDCAFAINGNETGDLIAMSKCEHHICSASTFSWWGAWLNQNPNKRVIMPKHWLTPGWNGHIHSNLIVPKQWERA